MENQTIILDLFSKMAIANFLRYFLAAGVAFVIFYKLYRDKWKHKRIQIAFPKTEDYRREFLYSMITIMIFVAIGMMIFATPVKSFTKIYANISTHGWSWWFVSLLLMILLHDTYFYWMHRLMHHPRLFKIFHLVHHKSTNPSPWAAYAFHPLEGIIEAGIIFPIVFMIPFHFSTLMVFLLFMIVYNVYGHLGYELFPKRFNKHIIGKWLNTSVNHNMHHKHFNGNYGLYFLFWDRMMGTLHPEYDKTYQEIDLRRGL